jgi:hypothetical protein
MSRMRVFVGYGYNERDRWIETYVLPLVSAFGWDIVHGKTVYGGALPDEVMQAIRNSHAMLGFTTRRDLDAAGRYRTHDWVIHELMAAHAQQPSIPWVEIREEGVLSPGGIIETASTLRIDYRENDRADCLVKIAQAIRRFQDLTKITTIRLGPVPTVEQIRPLLRDSSFSCSFQILRGAVEEPETRTAVLPIKGGLFVQLRGVAPGELVRITLSGAGRLWRSDYESADTVDVQVKE